MAGAGYKLFNTGDVLTAAQVNTYLQEQVVMVFNDAAARTTALSGVLAEGMVSYLKSTDAVEIYNGSAWVGIAADQTPLTTKGDLFTYSTTDARLAVGNNGETLVADSSTSTGLRWQGLTNGNAVINGAFDIAQRGTSFTGSNVYVLDRWQKGSNTNFTVSRQNSGLTGIQYSMRVQRNSGTTGGAGTLNVVHNIESVECYRFAGQPVTLSFWAKRGANYSVSGNVLDVVLASSPSVDQNYLMGPFASPTTVLSGTPTLTTSWQRFSFTATVGSNAASLAIYFNPTPTGTAGADDWYEITGVQLELGSVATTFRRAGGTLAGELAACQRYYFRNTGGSTYSIIGPTIGLSSTSATSFIPLPVQMRVKPSSVDFSNLMVNEPGVTNLTVTAVSLIADECGPNVASVTTTNSAGLTASRAGRLINGNNTAGYLGFSAEL